MLLNKIHTCQKRFFDSLKGWFFFCLLLYLFQSFPDEVNSIIEDVEKETLLVCKILVDGTLGNAKL